MEKKARPTTEMKRGSARETDPLGSNSEIARTLKKYYGGLVEEQVPERFELLLAKLEKSQKEEG